MLSDALPQTVRLNDGSTAILRNVTEDDAAVLVDFVRGIDGESDFVNRFAGEFAATVEQERTFIAGLRDSPAEFMVTAEIDGHIAGNGHSRGHTLKRFAHHAEVALAVRQQHWGKGLGKLIMGQLVDRGRRQGLRKLWLQVFDHNERAITMYESIGFELEGRARGEVLRGDGSYGDILRMGLPL